MLMHVTIMHRITAELEKLLIMLIYYLYFDSFSRVNQTFFLVVTKNKTIKRLLHQLKFLFAFKTSSIEDNLNICNWQQVSVQQCTLRQRSNFDFKTEAMQTQVFKHTKKQSYTITIPTLPTLCILELFGFSTTASQKRVNKIKNQQPSKSQHAQHCEVRIT